MQINRNNDKFIFFKITLTEIIMPIVITKNNTYLLQSNTNQSLSSKYLYVQTILYILQNDTKQKIFGLEKNKAYIVMN